MSDDLKVEVETMFRCPICRNLESSVVWATDCFEECQRLQEANERWRNGATLAEVFKLAWPDAEEALLELEPIHDTTREHGWSIEHWQCNKGPYYRLRTLEKGRRAIVGGVGGWMGYYQQEMPVRQLLTYPVQAQCVDNPAHAKHMKALRR